MVTKKKVLKQKSVQMESTPPKVSKLGSPDPSSSKKVGDGASNMFFPKSVNLKGVSKSPIDK